jgi:hypothetical protein
LLPIESRQKHFLHELAKSDDCGNELAMDYANSFALIDVLSSPGNLPRLRQAEIPWLRGDVSLRDYQLEGFFIIILKSVTFLFHRHHLAFLPLSLWPQWHFGG